MWGRRRWWWPCVLAHARRRRRRVGHWHGMRHPGRRRHGTPRRRGSMGGPRRRTGMIRVVPHRILTWAGLSRRGRRRRRRRRRRTDAILGVVGVRRWRRGRRWRVLDLRKPLAPLAVTRRRVVLARRRMSGGRIAPLRPRRPADTWSLVCLRVDVLRQRRRSLVGHAVSLAAASK